MKSRREQGATSIFLEAQGQLTLWYVVESSRISNSSKVLYISSLSANSKRIRSKKAEKTWRHHFPHYKSMEIFFNAQGQLTP